MLFNNIKGLMTNGMFCGFVSAIWFFSVTFAVVAAVAAVALFYFYAIKENCTENKIFVGTNAGLCFLICFVSIFPCTKSRKFMVAASQILQTLLRNSRVWASLK